MMLGKVIIVTPTEPAPFGSASARWYYALVKELARRRFVVRCLSVTNSQERAAQARRAVEPLGVKLMLYPVPLAPNWVKGKWNTLRRPFSYSFSSALVADLENEERAGIDVLHLEQLWTGYLMEGRPRALVIVHHLGTIDLQGPALGQGPRFLLERHIITSGESRLLRRLPEVGTLSNRLADRIRLVNPRAKVSVVPLAIETTLYDFAQEDSVSEPAIGFIGNMKWAPNCLAAHRLALDIFPLVKQRVPKAKLLLGGWYAREVVGSLIENSDITVLGDVPDAHEYYRRLQVLAFPVTRGSGVKVKVLEAMAWGTPVVTTTDGMEGVAAVDGEHCFVADGNRAFADRIVELLGSANLRRLMRTRARSLVEQEHSPQPAVDRLVQIYEAL